MQSLINVDFDHEYRYSGAFPADLEKKITEVEIPAMKQEIFENMEKIVQNPDWDLLDVTLDLCKRFSLFEYPMIKQERVRFIKSALKLIFEQKLPVQMQTRLFSIVTELLDTDKRLPDLEVDWRQFFELLDPIYFPKARLQGSFFLILCLFWF